MTGGGQAKKALWGPTSILEDLCGADSAARVSRKSGLGARHQGS